MQRSKSVRTLFVMIPLLMPLLLAGCGANSSGSSTNTGSAQLQMASVFMVATDAPLPSVVSCQLTINNVTLFNGSANVSVLAQSAVVDFAKLNGLHQLIDLNAIPTGTYTSATLTLAAPVVQFVDTSVDPPVVGTVANATLSSPTVTVPLNKPFTFNSNDLVGLRMELQINKSLATDSNGQITGIVNPAFKVQLLAASDANVSIDNFRGGVVGVTGNSSFVMQGPHGRRWTVSATSNTAIDTDPIGSFTTNTIAEVSGQINAVTKSIDATEVAALSNDKFALEGLLTSVRPSTGAAAAVDVYTRAELPDLSGMPLGQIATFTNLAGVDYRIANVSNPITALLFNNSAMSAGQVVIVGGALNTSTTPPTLVPHRIVLEPQGQSGSWVPGSTHINGGTGNSGSFQITDNKNVSGILLPSSLTIITTAQTRFINLNGLSDLSGTQPIPIRVVGFVLLNASHQPVFVARRVEELTS